MERENIFVRLKELQEEMKRYKMYLSEETNEDNINRLREKIAFNHGQITMLREFI